MKTEIVRADEARAVEQALVVLRNGGIVAFPTDTVYGVGALAFDERAVRKLYRAKGRLPEKAIPVLIADGQDLARVAGEVPEMARKLAGRFWPGPLTLVVPRHPDLPRAVSATDTVGVRVPDHPLALHLLGAAGPMAVTSANRAGAPNACTAAQVLADLEGRIDLLLDGGETPGGRPSTVVNCTGGALRVLREGPLSLEDLTAALS
ncbi:MAG: L-threonylcarbamoyladenylate synthase [Chloroflexota bacterium]